MNLKAGVLKIPDFSVLFAARILTAMSLQAQDVIVGWHVYALSHDPLLLGLIGLAEALPAIGFAFVAGFAVDKFKPAVIYRAGLLVLVINSTLLFLSTLDVLGLPPQVKLWLLFVAVFISGVVRSFTSPSVFSLISQIVPRPALAEAAAWNGWSFQMASISGPAIGGILYGTLGSSVAFAFPPVLVLSGLIVSRWFSSSTMQMRSPPREEAFFASVKSGIVFALKTKVLISAMTLDMFSVLFGGVVSVLPIFSDEILHMGSAGLGFLRAASSIGAGLVAMVLAFRPLRTISGRMLLFMVTGFGVCILCFAFTHQFWLAFLFLALSGAFDSVSMVIRQTILQLFTPSDMRGRVSSMSLIFITSSNEIGAFESGLAAKFLGLIPSIIFGGVMALAVVGVVSWRSPELRETKISP